MPVSLPNAFSRILSDGRLTADEVQSLKSAVDAGQISTDQLKSLATQYGDLFGAGAGQALVAIAPKGAVALAPPVRSLGDTRASAEVLSGAATLAQGSKHPAVLTYQRALDALASRTGKPEWGLQNNGGADGSFGAGTAKAVSQFQQDNGLPVTGAIDQMTALKMEELLMKNATPDVGGVKGSLGLPDGDKIAQAARDLVATRAEDYGVPGVWKSPNPSVPGNKVPLTTPLGAKDRWKCNLFGMDALYNGGAKPAQYPGGSYPIAIEIPSYSKGPNAPLIKMGEVWPSKDSNAQAKIDALLKTARPGDVIIVKHPGDNKADGGHTRIVVGNNYAADGTVDCAQAGDPAAHIRGETIDSFTGEDAFYLLRPAQTRGGS
jgi:peptidoglycan hydrolase-like protein with peptidoglycan-binding domain